MPIQNVWHRCIRYEKIGYQCPFQNLEEPLPPPPRRGTDYRPPPPRRPDLRLPDLKRPDLPGRDQPDPRTRIPVERQPYPDEFTIDSPRPPGGSAPRSLPRDTVDDVRRPLQPFTPNSSPYDIQLPPPRQAPIIEKYHTFPDGIPVSNFDLFTKSRDDDFSIDDPDDEENKFQFNFGEQYAAWIQRSLNERFNRNRLPLAEQLLGGLTDRQRSQEQSRFKPSYDSYVLEAQLGEENFVNALSRDSERAQSTARQAASSSSDNKGGQISNIAKSVGAGIAVGS